MISSTPFCSKIDCAMSCDRAVHAAFRSMERDQQSLPCTAFTVSCLHKHVSELARACRCCVPAGFFCLGRPEPWQQLVWQISPQPLGQCCCILIPPHCSKMWHAPRLYSRACALVCRELHRKNSCPHRVSGGKLWLGLCAGIQLQPSSSHVNKMKS